MSTTNLTAAAVVPGRGLRITYWIVTVLLCLNLFAGVLDIMKVEAIRQSTQGVGFPLGILPFLGAMKIIGGLVLLFVPSPLLKIAAYAGAIFYFLGAVAAHLSAGQPISAAVAALVMLVLAIASFLLWQRKSGLQVTTSN